MGRRILDRVEMCSTKVGRWGKMGFLNFKQKLDQCRGWMHELCDKEDGASVSRFCEL